MVIAALIFFLVLGLLTLTSWLSVRKANAPCSVVTGVSARQLTDGCIAENSEREAPFATGPPLLLQMLADMRCMQDLGDRLQPSVNSYDLSIPTARCIEAASSLRYSPCS